MTDHITNEEIMAFVRNGAKPMTEAEVRAEEPKMALRCISKLLADLHSMTIERDAWRAAAEHMENEIVLADLSRARTALLTALNTRHRPMDPTDIEAVRLGMTALWSNEWWSCIDNACERLRREGEVFKTESGT